MYTVNPDPCSTSDMTGAERAAHAGVDRCRSSGRGRSRGRDRGSDGSQSVHRYIEVLMTGLQRETTTSLENSKT